ncbi:uncharacterized protein LOC141655995 [Silene latifolia]|uniref:uncharacterized protein LOC141655995 n=1 Tax=Silene latifolia TaxID=37657 RepID=UPI003D7898F0
MDFKLAALKLTVAQLKEAIPHHSPASSFTLGNGGVLFQRAWLQGLLVSNDINNATNSPPRFLLDDGTGIVELVSINNQFSQANWQNGMYVMVVGTYVDRSDKHELPLIRIHKLVDLSAFPDREAMWYLEVIEAYRMFYVPFIEE